MLLFSDSEIVFEMHQGHALKAPGRLRQLTLRFGRLKKSSQSPVQALLLLMQCSVNQAEKFDILVFGCGV